MIPEVSVLALASLEPVLLQPHISPPSNPAFFNWSAGIFGVFVGGTVGVCVKVGVLVYVFDGVLVIVGVKEGVNVFDGVKVNEGVNVRDGVSVFDGV